MFQMKDIQRPQAQSQFSHSLRETGSFQWVLLGLQGKVKQSRTISPSQQDTVSRGKPKQGIWATAGGVLKAPSSSSSPTQELIRWHHSGKHPPEVQEETHQEHLELFKPHTGRYTATRMKNSVLQRFHLTWPRSCV